MKSLKTRINQKTQKGFQADLFKNEEGAIDLASIMVGVIVIGLIGGVIASTVFVVIPWAQDNAAKQQLDSVVQAENAYFGLSASTPSTLPAGYKVNSFGKSSDLSSANLLSTGPTYCATTPADNKSYDAYSQSSSGTIFTVNDKNSKPVIFTGTLPTDCQFITAAVSTSTPSASPTPTYIDPTPLTTSMTFKCDVATTGKIPIYSNYSLLDGVETWSDGYSKDYKNANLSTPVNRTLAAGVTYTVTYEGKYTNFSMFASMQSCIRSVDHIGMDTGVTNADYGFYNSPNLTSIPDHIPSTITSMAYMFYNSKLNPASVSNWDVSKVTNMESMFQNNTVFNQPLNSWNVSNVTNMKAVFTGTKYNQPLDKWTPISATNMDFMFSNATLFNQDISGWNVAKVTSYTNFAVSSPIASNSAYLPKFK